MADETVPMERHHRHTVLKVILISQVCLAVVTAAGVVFGYERLNGNIANGEAITHTAEKPEYEGERGPLNILVMGSDSREGESNDLESEGATDERSDTTILIHVSADRKDAYGVSLPRDAIIDRPDCRVKGETVPGEHAAMFNTAFTVGGAQCTIQTVEELTGIYIDHFVTVDFNGFKDMVDAVDGVEVCIPKDVDDDEVDIHLDAGTQELDRPGRAQLRARAPRPLAHRRHRPDEAAAGVHRLDGQQGDVGRHAVAARPGLLLPRRGHRVDRGRRGPRLPRRDVRPGHPVQGHRAGAHQVRDGADRGVRTRPQPAGLDPRGQGPVAADPRGRAARRGLQRGQPQRRRPGRYAEGEGSSSGNGGSGGDSADDEERLAAGLCA